MRSGYGARSRLDWLVTEFTDRVMGVAHAVVVSADGVPLAVSAAIPPERAGQLCAITSGLAGLTEGAARMFEGGSPVQVLVEMAGGIMILKAVSGGSSLAVLAGRDCDIELLAHEMTLLVEEVGHILTPAVRGRPDDPW